MFKRLLGPALMLLALPPAGWSDDEVEDPREAELQDLSTENARSIVGMFRVHIKEAEEPKQIIKLLEELAGEGRHSDISQELAKYVKHREVDVQLAAVKLLGTQRDEVAQKVLLNVLKPGRSFDVALAEEAAKSIGYTGYGKRGYKQLVELFFEEGHTRLRRNIIKSFGQQQEKESVSLLIALLDEPQPMSVNSPSNPPADYWVQKNKEWRMLNPTAIRSLSQITGRRFVKSEDAIEWVKNEGKKVGIKYRKVRLP